MMKKSKFTYLVLAILMGVGAAFLADSWIQQRITPDSTTELEYEPIIIADMDIPFGHKIQLNQLKVMEWPKATALPAGVVQKMEDAEGRIASQTILNGEMVLASRIVEQGSGSTLAAVISPNKRAITLRVNDVVGVAGFLLPGNRVDVLASRKINKQVTSKTLLEDLKVLAVDQTASTEKDKPIVVRAVTIEAEPKQAEKLFKATEEGRIQLVLRNPTDRAEKVATVAPAPAPVSKAPKRTRKAQSFSTVTVIRGTHVDISKARL